MADLSFEKMIDNELVVVDADGLSYTLAVTPELRAAINQPAAPSPAESSEPLTPRGIQAMLRSGMSAEDISHLSNQTVEHIRRFESPVLAERAYVVERALEMPVGRHPDSPVLGDLAVDRLVTREVDPESLVWTAVRDGSNPWMLILSFPLESGPAEALWEVDLQARALKAVDDEARWLSETDSSPRHRAPITPLANRHDVARETESLLANLSQSRGTRQPIMEMDEDEPDLLDELETTPPAPVVPFPSRRDRETESHVSASARAESPEESVSAPSPEAVPSAPSPEPVVEEEKKVEQKKRPRSNRRSVPSWDEIVFGSKND